MISIKSISKTLKLAMESKISTPAKAIAGIILLCGLMKRPGLSTILSVAKIAEKLGALGIPTNESPDGTPNMMMQYTYCIVDEIYRALREDAKMHIAIGPGALTVQAGPYTGTNITVGQEPLIQGCIS